MHTIPSVRLSHRVLVPGFEETFLRVQGQDFRFFPSALRVCVSGGDRGKQQQQLCWGRAGLFRLLSVRDWSSPLTLAGPAQPPRATRGMQALTCPLQIGSVRAVASFTLDACHQCIRSWVRPETWDLTLGSPCGWGWAKGDAQAAGDLPFGDLRKTIEQLLLRFGQRPRKTDSRISF